MKNLKNNKGITLIALVITIIVLIILAGISINLLLGDNGIIKKAQEAGERYKVAADEEEEKLANAESAIDRIWQGLGLDDNSQGGGNPPVISKDTGALGAPVNVDKYGERVFNYNAQNLVWRLFYEDSNNIYLISETQDGDYPLNNVQSCNYENNTYAPKNSKYVSGESVSAQGKVLMPLLGGATSSSAGTVTIGTNNSAINLLTSNNTNPNIWATAYLCDTDDNGPWAAYKTGVASWAMGGPTAELYVASWNAVGAGNQIILGIANFGYEDYSNNGWISTSVRNGIYRLKSSGSWLLASPNRNQSDFVHRVYETGGYLGWSGANQIDCARPIVCLQKSNFTCQFEVSKDTGTLSAPVNADKYGRIVNNYTAQNLVWRLFYEDSNNIYLISETQDKDYPLQSVQLWNYTNNNVNTYTAIDSKYVSGESVSTQGQALMPLASSLFVSTNTNPNILGTAYLCDTDDNGPWKDYKIGNASWAMGGPTIELFAASYNATHTNHQITLGVGINGYTENTGQEWFLKTENGGIYRLRNTGYWWIASPTQYTSFVNMVHRVSDGGGGLCFYSDYWSESARPVVCLQKVNFTYELAAQDW